ncbi:hypothetical protein [Lysinibacillus sp. 54212]|uniref:hypothetical protein n=1 Tax=Lysinibacillus sp. 54212 TaxID=3119829 RepID=UPI002FCB4E85
MRNLKRFQRIVTILLILNLFTNYVVVADDDIDEEHEYYEGIGNREEHEDELYEEIGEVIGWCTIILIGAAGLLFIVRRIMKPVITTFPTSKHHYISFTKFLGKYHILIGVTALVLGIAHGLLMYFNEGELDSKGIIGVAAVILFVIGAIDGTILNKNRKNKSARTIHMFLVALGVVLGVIHIVI